MGDEAGKEQAGKEQAAGGQTPPAPVPYDRFQEVVAERNRLRDERDTLKREAQGLTEKAATADTLAAQLRDEQAARSKDAQAWRAEATLMQAGLLDPEGRQVASFLYGQIDEKERPTLDEWITQIKADPSKGPKSLQAWFAPPAVAAAASAGAAAEQAPADKKETRAAGKVPGAIANGEGAAAAAGSSNYTAEQIKAARLKGMSGDWSEYEAMRPHIGAVPASVLRTSVKNR